MKCPHCGEEVKLMQRIYGRGRFASIFDIVLPNASQLDELQAGMVAFVENECTMYLRLDDTRYLKFKGEIHYTK